MKDKMVKKTLVAIISFTLVIGLVFPMALLADEVESEPVAGTENILVESSDVSTDEEGFDEEGYSETSEEVSQELITEDTEEEASSETYDEETEDDSAEETTEAPLEQEMVTAIIKEETTEGSSSAADEISEKEGIEQATGIAEEETSKEIAEDDTEEEVTTEKDTKTEKDILSKNDKKVSVQAEKTMKDLSAKDADLNTKIIQAELDKAKTATASKPAKVTIPTGTWPIRMLKVYSNTEIILKGTLKRVYENNSDSNPMLYTMYAEGKNQGGYTRASNIKISGGTWDSNSFGKSYNSNVMHFAHSKNITIENTTIQNCGASHAIILDGVKDATINKVTFKNCKGKDTESTETFVSETIHIDSCSSALHAGSAEPFDHTNCQNIKVTNNTFNNVITCVGAHKHQDKVTKQDIHNNITISGNTFSNVEETCVNGVRINNLTVSNNKAKNNAKLFVRIHATTNFKVTGNNVDGPDRFAYAYITDDLKEISNGTFSGNVVKNITGKGVADRNGSVVHAYGFAGNFKFENEDYSIKKSSKYTIYVSGSNATIKNSKLKGGSGVRLSAGKFDVTGNTISGTSTYSLFIDKAPGSNVQNNTISDCAATSFSVLFLDGTNKSTIKNNKISGVTAGGVYIRSSSNNTFTGNYVTGMKNGKLPVYMGEKANNNKITDNFFSGTKDAWAANDCKGNTIKNNILMFSDVMDPGKYYFQPVYWAAKKGITKGYDDGTFGPQKNCTRAQIVTFLWRLAGKPNPKTKKNPFKDLNSKEYYYKAVLWAAEKGITSGYSDGTFKPNATCLREHVVTFLWRYAGKPNPKTNKNPFNDIKTKDYYYKAVLWANEKGIAKGYNSGAHKGGFGPKLDCQREHVVTFLYRYAK